MNERIEKLAEQARIKDHWSIDEGRYLTNYLDEKKFAELIIQECGVALSPMLRDMVSRGQAFDLIKQHFGVEE